jgi:hypothetical protein
MIDRVRAFLNRPLRDVDRTRLFALTVAVVLIGAAALAVLDGPKQPAAPSAAQTDREPAPLRSLPAEPAASPAVPAAAPSEEGQPPAALEASRADVTAAKRAARRFLAGYLPYSYGRRGARRIANVDARLRRRLLRERPRVPAAERRHRPRLVLLQAHGVAPRAGELVALVSDGARRYTVPLELARSRAGWRVTDVGS